MTRIKLTESQDARDARVADLMRKNPCCRGCGVPFAKYGLTNRTVFVDGRHLYCNADCHGEAEVAAAERAEYAALGEDY